jgi:hypothetical protein
LWPQGGDVRLVLRYDEGLSHRMYAGADMILIPSVFEPCGLTQVLRAHGRAKRTIGKPWTTAFECMSHHPDH